MDVQIAYDQMLRSTDKAYLMTFENGEEVWFPKSQVHVDTKDKDITLPLWLVEKNGLTSYIISS